MKLNLVICILIATLFSSCETSSKKILDDKTIVENFVQAYNDKDETETLNYLHKNFVQLFEKDTAITNKEAYVGNFNWGKVMNDRLEIEIINIDEKHYVEAIATYYSDRDKLLGVSPYKSRKTFSIQDQQIIKILEGNIPDNDTYDNPRREKYTAFSNWLSTEHELSFANFPFNKKGAIELKLILEEYANIRN